jgi:hypothetical protein
MYLNNLPYQNLLKHQKHPLWDCGWDFKTSQKILTCIGKYMLALLDTSNKNVLLVEKPIPTVLIPLASQERYKKCLKPPTNVTFW